MHWTFWRKCRSVLYSFSCIGQKKMTAILEHKEQLFIIKRLFLQKGFHPHRELGDIWVSQPVKGDFADLQSIYLSLLPVIKFPRYFCWRGTLLQPIYFSSLLGLHLLWEMKEWKPFKNKWTYQTIICIHYSSLLNNSVGCQISPNLIIVQDGIIMRCLKNGWPLSAPPMAYFYHPQLLKFFFGESWHQTAFTKKN